MVEIIVHYGYTDGTGEYYIVIDTDKCDGCGECIRACPKGVFELGVDDYDETVAMVKKEMLKSISYICPGYHHECSSKEINCHKACQRDAISHTW